MNQLRFGYIGGAGDDESPGQYLVDAANVVIHVRLVDDHTWDVFVYLGLVLLVLDHTWDVFLGLDHAWDVYLGLDRLVLDHTWDVYLGLVRLVLDLVFILGGLEDGKKMEGRLESVIAG